MSNPRTVLRFENDRLFYFALLLAVAPLWLARYLPGIDIPGHVAQATALGELFRGSPAFSELFEINWFTPYLTGTLILYLLSLAMPVGIAIKLVFSIIIVAIPILSGKLLEALQGDSRWKWLIIPSTYSFAFYWGFYPFLVAVPLGLILLLLTIRFNRQPNVALGFGIAAYSIFLLLSHLLVLGFSSLLALAWLAGSNYRNIRRLIVLSLPYTAPLPLIGLWLADTQSSATYMSNNIVAFGPMTLRLQELIIQPSGLDGKFFIVSLLVTAVIIGMPFVARAKLTRKPERWAMAICGFGTFMIFPAYALGTAFLYQRFGLYLPLLWFMLWDKPNAETYRWHWVGMVAVVLWASTNVMRFAAFNVETRDFDKIVAVMEPGKRAAAMVAANRSRHFTYPVYMHFPSWYQAEKRGIVDFNFGMFYGTMARYKSAKQPPYGDALAWNPGAFRWDENNGDTYDYFVVRADVDVSAPIFKEHRSAVKLVAREGWWWLYKQVDADR